LVGLVLSCSQELPSITLVVVDAGDPSVVHVHVNLFELCFAADVILAPTNVRIKRLSPTEMEISWNAPTVVGTAQVTGYAVHYTAHVTPGDIDRWPSVNTGPVTSVRIGQLEPRTVYAAAVRARSADNRLGSFSDIAVDNHIGKLTFDLSLCLSLIIYFCRLSILGSKTL